MPKQKLGKKEYIQVSEVFDKENKDFTPWLNENLELLSEALNLEIINSTSEEDVGDFSCDIFAEEAGSGRKVIIENQYGKTDHDHLGKVFTYAAGKEAAIVIWLAEKFRPEHSRTLEWLNEKVDNSELSFFAVEFRLIRVDNSAPAPDFDVVVQPNEWQQRIKNQGRSTNPSGDNYLDFFSMLTDKYSEMNPEWRRVRPSSRSSLGFGAGKGGLYYMWAFRSQNRVSVELYFDTPDRAKNKKLFDEIASMKDKIAKDIKGLSWERLDDKKASRIAIYKDIGHNIRSLPKEEYPQVVEWAASTMTKYVDTFSMQIKFLDIL